MVTIPAGQTSVTFDAVVEGLAPPGHFVTATAVRFGAGGGSSSEFSAPVVAVAEAPPQVQAAEFRYQAAPHAVRYTFDADVSASLSASDLVLRNLTTGATCPSDSCRLSYDRGTNTATIAYVAGSGVLPTATTGGAVGGRRDNDNGTPLAADTCWSSSSGGDVNLDRSVNGATSRCSPPTRQDRPGLRRRDVNGDGA